MENGGIMKINQSIIMEVQNKKQRIKSIIIYFTIAIFTIFVNFFIFLFATKYIIVDFTDYLSSLYYGEYIRFGIFKGLAVNLMFSIFLLLIVECVIVKLFYKRLNRFFKIENLFTIKKFIWIAIIIITMQTIISCWLWQNGGFLRVAHPVEDKEMIEALNALVEAENKK
jgi:hypothetical protein